MPRVTRIVLLASLAVTLVPARAPAGDPRAAQVTLSRLTGALVAPVAIATLPDARVLVAERAGRVRLYVPGSGLRATPYLDIRARVNDSGGEQGLLGLAPSPWFASNGFLFAAYTDAQGDLRVVRFRGSPTGSTASTTETLMIEIPHRLAGNHNGGMLAFGPDRFLYISTGDGGGAGDPEGNAQRLDRLNGKILRIDVDHACGTRRYCIPTTNPFAGRTGRRGEIWHYGLRNTWRFSFDKVDGSLWMADVGQGAREEVDLSSKGIGGLNWGWDCREGTLSTTYANASCSGKTFRGPIYTYSHANGRCSITGGYVYRGSTYATFIGRMYLFADYCTGEILALARQSDGSFLAARMLDHTGNITTFGQAPNGELYVADAGGSLYSVRASAR